VTARSKASVCGRSLVGVAGSNPAGAWMSAPCACCVWSCTGLCDGSITRPEEPYRAWNVLRVVSEPRPRGYLGPPGMLCRQRSLLAIVCLHINLPISALTNKYKRETGYKIWIFKTVLKKTRRNGNQETRKWFWITRRTLHP
jgi:hypothetical protein